MVAATLEKDLSTKVHFVDLYELNLPVYDDSGEGDWLERWPAVSEGLAKSDGFVFVSPEWDGMFSVGLHNFLHYVSLELADKPVYLVGVSSGRGGRYPLVQMRVMGYKNRHFVVIPEQLYIDHVKEALVDGVWQDERNKKRLHYGLSTLIEYAKALTLVRQSGVLDYDKYKSGL